MGVGCGRERGRSGSPYTKCVVEEVPCQERHGGVVLDQEVVGVPPVKTSPGVTVGLGGFTWSYHGLTLT